MQLYVSEYMADTRHLDTEEHGAYLLLMMNYFETGKPILKSRAQAIAGMKGNDRWTTVEKSLNDMFIDTGDRWEHSRIEADLEVLREAQEQRANAGKASAEARKRKKREAAARLHGQSINDRSTTVETPLKGCSTNRDKNRIDNSIKKHCPENPDGGEERYETSKPGKFLTKEKLETFKTFWDLFDDKGSGGKPRAAKSWHEQWKHIEPNLQDVYLAARLEGEGRASLVASGGRPKRAEGWITDRRWEGVAEKHPADHASVLKIFGEELPAHPQNDIESWRQSEGYQHLQSLWGLSERNRNLDFWRDFFQAVGQDPYCTGDNAGGTKVSLGWLVLPRNFNRIMESA